MGWKNAPQKRQKHRAVIEIDGPVDKKTWTLYRSLVKAIARAHGGSAKALGRFRKVRGVEERVGAKRKAKKKR